MSWFCSACGCGREEEGNVDMPGPGAVEKHQDMPTSPLAASRQASQSPPARPAAEQNQEGSREEEESPAEKEEKVKLERMPLQERTEHLLLSGALRLLSSMWLMSRGEGYILKRMQDLPEDAFVPPDRAAKLFDKYCGVIVMSYGWLSRKHPDPLGLHMRSVRTYLRKHKARFDAFHSEKLDYGIFWDFASLPQDRPDGTKKTAKEKRVLDRGLGAVPLLYGDEKTLVIQLTRMPKELPLPAEYETNLTPYGTRGWCFFEATVSSTVKASDKFLDLSVGAAVLERGDADWRAVKIASMSMRWPPLTPEDMTTELQKRRFTNAGDNELLLEKYREFFAEVPPAAQALDFSNSSTGQGWGSAELAHFARALPSFAACQELYLQGHTALTGDSLECLRVKLPELPALQVLFLPAHVKETAQGKALKEEWRAAGKSEACLQWW